MDTMIVPVQTDGLNRNLRRYDIQVLKNAVNNNLICKSNEDITNKMIRYALSKNGRMCGKRSFIRVYGEMIAELQQIFLSRDRSFNTIEKVVRHDSGEIWRYAESINATEGNKWNENYLRSMKVAQSTRRN